MVKVLHILSATSASRGDMVVVMNYFKHIDKSGVSFDFAKMQECKDNIDDELISLGGKTFFFEKPGLKNWKRSVDKLIEIINVGNYDVVHLHVPVIQWFVKKAMKSCKCKNLIIHSHSTKLSSKFLNRIRNRFLILNINKNLSGRFACSKEAGLKLFGKSFGKKENDYVINNAIDLKKYKFNVEEFKTTRQELGVSNETVSVCHVGRFSNEKNHDRLIDIFNELYKKDNKFKLFLIGDGPLRPAMEEKVKNLGLTEQVSFLGNRKDVPKLLKGMDIFLFTSLFEGLGLSLIEAQAAGLLCFSSDACPEESKKTENVYRVSLAETNKFWCDLIFEKHLLGWNRNTSADIEEQNYGIETEANKLLSIYNKIVK